MIGDANAEIMTQPLFDIVQSGPAFPQEENHVIRVTRSPTVITSSCGRKWIGIRKEAGDCGGEALRIAALADGV